MTIYRAGPSHPFSPIVSSNLGRSGDDVRRTADGRPIPCQVIIDRIATMSSSSIATGTAFVFVLALALLSFALDRVPLAAAHWALRGPLASMSSSVTSSSALPVEEKRV